MRQFTSTMLAVVSVLAIGMGVIGPPGRAAYGANMVAGVDSNGAVHNFHTDLTGNLMQSVASSSITLLTATTDAVAHTVNITPVTGIGEYKQVQILLSVTAAAAAVGDTLDVYVDTSPNAGGVWINAVHFTQVLGNGGAKAFWAVIDPAGSAGTSVVAVSTDASSGVVRPSILCDYVRVRYTIVDGGAHGQSFTFSVLAFGKS